MDHVVTKTDKKDFETPRVRDIMTREVAKVRPDSEVGEISLLMSRHGISGLPVVDETDRVLGVVTELDLVVRNTRFKMPGFLTLLGATIYLETPEHIRRRLEHILGVTAKEIMTAPALTIDASASIEELAELMVQRRMNPIPVVEGERLVGIVSRSDLVRLMARGAREE